MSCVVKLSIFTIQFSRYRPLAGCELHNKDYTKYLIVDKLPSPCGELLSTQSWADLCVILNYSRPLAGHQNRSSWDLTYILTDIHYRPLAGCELCQRYQRPSGYGPVDTVPLRGDWYLGLERKYICLPLRSYRPLAGHELHR